MMRPRFALGIALGAASLVGAPARAQYPLAPSAVLDMASLSATPQLTGYVSFRETVRRDTSTFILNRARIAVQTRPLPWTAVRLQADFVAVGRSVSDTVPAFALTDGFVQFQPVDSTRGIVRALRPALLVGQFRTPFSQEFQTPFSVLPYISRSRAVDRIAPRRDIGVLARLRAGSALTLLASLVNGEGPNRTSNPDGKQMVIARLTLQPIRAMVVSGKWASQSADHRWGADARVVAKRLVMEGETIARRGPVSGAASTEPFNASGAYFMVAYRARNCMRPMVKVETMRESPASPAPTTHARWLTGGLDFLGPRDRTSLQIDLITKRETPVAMPSELVIQLKALF